MGRKIRSEEGGSSSTSTASGGVLSPQEMFLVRAYSGTSGAERDEYVTKGTQSNPYKVSFEEGVSVDLRFYDYAAYSDDAGSGGQNIYRINLIDGEIPGIGFSNNTYYKRLDQTPSSGSAGTYTYAWRIYNIIDNVRYDDNSPSHRDFYVQIEVLPEDSTPIWIDSTTFSQVVARNTSDFTIVAEPSTQSSYENVSYSISGDFPSYAVLDSSTGRLYVPSVPNLQEDDFTVYTFTITATISESGSTISRTYNASLKVNDPFGAVYFGPGSLKSGSYGVRGDYTSSSNPGYKYGTNWFNSSITSGALRYNSGPSIDTTPYDRSGYGLTYAETYQFSSSTTGYLGSKDTSECTQPATQVRNNNCYRFKWVVPAGVTSICAVAVGGGCGGAYQWSSEGGGGGGMAWCNDITVTPGEELTIQVGTGGYYFSSNSSYWGGVSFVRREDPAEYFVIGYGGGYQSGHVLDTVNGNPSTGTSTFSGTVNGRSNPQTSGLIFVQQYTYNSNQDAGSAAASTLYGTYSAQRGGQAASRGGGGAAGYTGRGGDNSTERGYGGGGGAGYYYSSTYGCSGGGGVGLDGQGNNGRYSDGSGYSTGNTSYRYNGMDGWAYTGGGGSGGSRGAPGENQFYSSGVAQNRQMDGGQHGGGGGGSGTSWGGGGGGMGGVRIIWGEGRAFPNTLCSEDPNWNDLTQQQPS